MDRIATILGIDSEATISNLRAEIADTADLYLSLKKHIDERSSAGEMRKALRSLLSLLEKSIEKIEDLDKDTRTAIELASVGSEKTWKYEIILGDDDDYDVLAEGERNIKLEIASLLGLRDDVELAHNKFPKPQRGAQKKAAKLFLYRKLADIYERSTGNPAKAHRTADGHVSLFVKFVLACLRPIENVHSTSGLVQQLKVFIRES